MAPEEDNESEDDDGTLVLMQDKNICNYDNTLYSGKMTMQDDTI